MADKTNLFWQVHSTAATRCKMQLSCCMVSQAQQGHAACNVNLYYNLHLSCTAAAWFHRLHKNKERTPECTGERRCDRVRSRVTAVAHANFPVCMQSC